jgi:ferredoxin
MTIREIYEAFDKIGCLSFATVNERGEPEARIAHLRAWDDDGIYFMTMHTKDFYRQLKATGKVSVNGLCADTEVRHDADGLPLFDAGYAIRMTGSVKEIPMEEIRAKNDPRFDLCVRDQARYPAMVVFCITAARGDVFDYDFEKQHRGNKLERTYFSYHGAAIRYKGLAIDQARCIGCGICRSGCSFLAVRESGGKYTIDPARCDECGDCLVRCPAGAVETRR